MAVTWRLHTPRFCVNPAAHRDGFETYETHNGYRPGFMGRTNEWFQRYETGAVSWAAKKRSVTWP